MPLHCANVARAIAAHRLDDAVIGARLDLQAAREALDRLVMDRYDAPRPGLAIEARETGMRLEAHLVRMLVVVVRAVGGNVLVQAAAERDVDQLRAAADAEHRLPRRGEGAHQLDLVAIAQWVARPFGLQRLLAVGERTDIRTALQDQAIERLRIVGGTRR